MAYSQFLGIDISKNAFDATLLSNGTDFVHHAFKNNTEGFAKLQQWLSKLGVEKDTLLACMEGTGRYAWPLCIWLYQNNYHFGCENPYAIKHSMGIVRGKDDKKDSGMIAEYASRFSDKVRSQKVNTTILDLKILKSERTKWVKIMAGVKATNKAKVVLIEHLDIEQHLEAQGKHYRYFKAHIRLVEDKMEALVFKDEQMSKQYTLLTSIPFVGRQTAMAMIIATEGFTKFKNPRKFATHTGIAPFKHESGKWKGKTRTVKIADKQLKALLSIVAVNTLKDKNSEFRKYYDRKRAQGKEHWQVINAIRNKLVHRMFAVIRRDTPFVALNH